MNSRFAILSLLLHVCGYVSQMGRKPVITLFIIGILSVFYLNSSILGIYADRSRACISYESIIYRKQFDRLWWHSFIHLSDMHLYYNMINLLLKGGDLEFLLGKFRFVVFIIMAIPIIGVVYISIALFLNCINGGYYGNLYINECAAGFSGVLFALRVVELSVLPPNTPFTLLGFPSPIPNHFIVWIELLLNYLLMPNSSLIGHLSGILVGLLYSFGPLKTLIDIICQSHTETNIYWIPFMSIFRRRLPRRPYGEHVDEEPYMYPNRTQDSSSALFFDKKELMRQKILSATEKRLTRPTNRRN